MDEIKEDWKNVPIPKFASKYQVSNLGNIKTVRTGRILKKEKMANGYHRVSLATPGLGKTSEHYSVHRLVALAFIENTSPEIKTAVNHIDGVKTNNIAANLEWMSLRENAQHAIDTGLKKKTASRAIIIVDYEGNVFEFQSIKEACKKAELGENTILRALRKGNKPFGLTITYKNPDEKKKPVSVDLSEFEELKNYPGYYINKEGKIFGKTSGVFLNIRTPFDYPTVSLLKNNRRLLEKIHRLLAIQYLPNPNNHPMVNHIDHNKLNYALDNLEWCSYKENSQKYLEMKLKKSVLNQSKQLADGSGENSEVEE